MADTEPIESKQWWESMTNWTQIGLVVSIFAPAKYKDLVGPTVESIADIVLIAAAIYGRWRAGGVSLPLLGVKK